MVKFACYIAFQKFKKLSHLTTLFIYHHHLPITHSSTLPKTVYTYYPQVTFYLRVNQWDMRSLTSNFYHLDFPAVLENIYPSSMKHSLLLAPTVLLFSPQFSLFTLRWFLFFGHFPKFCSCSSSLHYFSPLAILSTSATSLRENSNPSSWL